MPLLSKLSPLSPQTWTLIILMHKFMLTRDHLLLSCEYSQAIWREIFIRCQPPASPFANWSEVLSWIRAARSWKLNLLRKLATQSVIYHLWKWRNNLIHNHTSLSVSSIFHCIDKELRNIISARKGRKQFRSLMSMWLRWYGSYKITLGSCMFLLVIHLVFILFC